MRIYRGKTKQNGEWVYGYFVKEKSYCCIWQGEDNVHPAEYPYFDENMGTIDGKLTPVLIESVGQCSMVKDKYEIDMFEGDIVAGALSWLEHKKYGIVAFRDGSFGLLWYRGKAEQFTPFAHLCNIEYEVIGNIVDDIDFLFKEILPNE